MQAARELTRKGTYFNPLIHLFQIIRSVNISMMRWDGLTLLTSNKKFINVIEI